MDGDLASTVKLPGLDGGPAGWNPIGNGPGALRALAQLEAEESAKVPDREAVETLSAVSPVFKNNADLAAWDPEQDQSEAA
jgi:hypothetical protein